MSEARTPSVADRLAPAVLILAAAAALVPSAVSSVLSPDRTAGMGTERLVRAVLLLALFLVLSVSVAVTLRSGGVLRLRNGALALALLAYWAVGMGSLVLNDRSVPQLSALATPVIIMGLGVCGGGPRLGVRVAGYSLLGVCYASLALAIAYPRTAFPSGPEFEETRLLGFLFDYRLAGVSSHPNTIALLAAAAALFVLVHRVKLWQLHVVVAVLVLMLSESRATMTASLVAVGVLAGLSKTRDGSGGTRLVRTTAVVDWALIVLLPLLASVGLMNISFNGRTSIWDYSLSRIDERPAFGFGPGVWKEFIAAGDLRELATSGHNQFVESLASVGALGVFVLAVIAVLWLRSLSSSRCTEFSFSAVAFVLVWTIAIFEAPIGLWGVNPQSWLLLMLTVGCLGLESESRSSAEPDGARREPGARTGPIDKQVARLVVSRFRLRDDTSPRTCSQLLN